MRKQIIETLDENIVILFDTLNNFNKMPTKGIDQPSTAFMRRTKKEFIEKTKKDIDILLKLKKKYQTQ